MSERTIMLLGGAECQQVGLERDLVVLVHMQPIVEMTFPQCLNHMLRFGPMAHDPAHCETV